MGKRLHDRYPTLWTEQFDSHPIPESVERGRRGQLRGQVRPYVVSTPQPCRESGDHGLSVRLSLFGAAALQPEPWIECFRDGLEAGVRGPRRRMTVVRQDLCTDINLARWAEIRIESLAGPWAPWALLQVNLRSPVAIKSGGCWIWPDPPALTNALLRRARDIRSTWCGAEPMHADWAPLLDAASTLRSSQDYDERFEPVEGKRFSHRQGTTIPLDGSVGRWIGWVPRPVMLLLAAGELLHAGKGTAVGQGEIQLGAPTADLPAAPPGATGSDCAES